eukprot:6294170-Amphidinium_carterae.1
MREVLHWNPTAHIFYAHTLHRFDALDMDFFHALIDAELVYHPVAAEAGFAGDELTGLDPVEDSSGYLEDLFPEKRIAVYQISRQGAAGIGWSGTLSRPLNSEVHEYPQAERTRDEGDSRMLRAADGNLHIGRVRIILPAEAKAGDTTRDWLRTDDSGFASSMLASVQLTNLGPFGSGEHPTTALMVLGLPRLHGLGKLQSSCVCDFGCGSGLLALLSIALGATRAIGIDNVPDALAAAAENAGHNGCPLDSDIL